jgi:large subunit ribosomal protein L22
MESNATAKFVRISPTKARQVVDMIRGKDVNEALGLLRFTPKKAALYVEKTIRSAAANVAASEAGGEKVELDSLYVKSATVDGGPIWKRWRARAMGRATPIRKRTSHIRVTVAVKAGRERNG